jgi:ankyrin repeat protein
VLEDGSVNVNGFDVDGETALTWSAYRGYLPTCDFLLKAGASVNAQNNQGWTSLLGAAHLDDYVTARCA